MKREWVCDVSGAGHLPGKVRLAIADTIRSLAGKKVRVTVEVYQKKRSLNQNAYMHGVVVKMIADAFREAGNAVDDKQVFEYLKDEVWKLRQVYVDKNGEVTYGPGSTRHWTTIKCEEKLEEARAWAAEHLGISIPLPHENL
jgi:hypothetical protein